MPHHNLTEAIFGELFKHTKKKKITSPNVVNIEKITLSTKSSLSSRSKFENYH